MGNLFTDLPGDSRSGDIAAGAAGNATRADEPGGTKFRHPHRFACLAGGLLLFCEAIMAAGGRGLVQYRRAYFPGECSGYRDFVDANAAEDLHQSARHLDTDQVPAYLRAGADGPAGVYAAYYFATAIAIAFGDQK